MNYLNLFEEILQSASSIYVVSHGSVEQNKGVARGKGGGESPPPPKPKKIVFFPKALFLVTHFRKNKNKKIQFF